MNEYTPSTEESKANEVAPFERPIPDVTIDLRGLWCPLPPLRTMRALQGMAPGEVLEVLGTNPIGNRVSPWVSRGFGHELLGTMPDPEGFQRAYYRRA